MLNIDTALVYAQTFGGLEAVVINVQVMGLGNFRVGFLLEVLVLALNLGWL